MQNRNLGAVSRMASLAILLAGMLASTGSTAGTPRTGVTAEARSIHERAIVLDTHFDTPANLGRPGWSIMDRHEARRDGDQVDLPRMVDGGVDGGFFAIYTPSSPQTPEADRAARDFAFVRAVQIREMIARHADRFMLALTAADAKKATAQGKRSIFISMENGSPFEADIGLMRTFRALGVTMMGPVHMKNNALADSATDQPEWHGLSAKGREFIAEARLGIVVDLSHASDEVLRQAVALSRAPVILSHSGMRAVYDHPRNVSDEDAKLVADHGGVVSITAFRDYMVDTPEIAARTAAIQQLVSDFATVGTMTVAQKRKLIAQRDEIDRRYPVPGASLRNFMDHLLHAIDVLGIDHVGISGDFDGGGGFEGLDDVTDYPKITEALLKAGYSPDDIAKLLGGNVLRVLREVQAFAGSNDLPKVPIVN